MTRVRNPQLFVSCVTVGSSDIDASKEIRAAEARVDDSALEWIRNDNNQQRQTVFLRINLK